MKTVAIFVICFALASTVFAFDGKNTERAIIDYAARLIKSNSSVDSVYVSMYSPRSRLVGVEADKILSVKPLDNFDLRYQRFLVSHQNGSKESTLTVTLELKVFSLVAVPAEHIFQGQENFSNKIEYKLVNITEFRNIVMDKGSFAGMRALTNLQAGIPVSRNSLRKIPHVSRNSRITVVYEKNSIALSFEAKALREGYIGDRVHFRNPFNQQVKFGTVIAENKVEIR